MTTTTATAAQIIMRRDLADATAISGQTVTPNRPEHANRTTAVPGAPRFSVRRILTGYAYAANGNLHNPTPRYDWLLLLDGRMVDRDARQAPLVAAARQANAVTLYSA